MKIKYHDINILGLFVKYFEIWLFDYFYNFKKYLYLQNSILYKKYIKKNRYYRYFSISKCILTWLNLNCNKFVKMTNF